MLILMMMKKVNIKDFNIMYDILNGITKRYYDGDLNRDGVVDSQDLDLFTRVKNGEYTLDDEQKWLADLDGDKEVTDKDYDILVDIINADYIKGDLDKNGVVDANDASIALELFKSEKIQALDIKIGDMDGNNLLDANDASLILELYKTNK